MKKSFWSSPFRRWRRSRRSNKKRKKHIL